jgi:hypothetical protein
MSRAPTGILIRPENPRDFSLRPSTKLPLPLLITMCRGIAFSYRCFFVNFSVGSHIGKNAPPHPRSHPLGILLIVHEIWIIPESIHGV